MFLFSGKRNSLLLFICFFSTTSLGNAQTYYYGQDSIGCLEIKNDSVLFAYFIDCWRPVTGSYEEVFYHRKGDTIFLSTHNKPRARIDTAMHINTAEKDKNEQSVPVIIKVFHKKDSKKSSSPYNLVYEDIEYLDTVTNRITTNIISQEAAIIVIKIAHTYLRVFVPEKNANGNGLNENGSAVSIDVSGAYANHGLFLEDFPLLIDGDCLCPIDAEKNFQCWIDNGFYFPVMQKKLEKRYFRYPTAEWNIGLQGLSGFFSFQL